MRRLLLVPALLTAAALAGCGSSGSSSSSKTSTTAPAPKYAIRTIYATPTSKDEALAKELLSAGGTAAVAKELGKQFKLPWNVRVVVRSTSDSGPYYNPQDHTINLDYGFANFVLEQVKRIDPSISDFDLGKSVAAINSFIFMHEFAHLLIDAFDLPITGKEEDAADQLATIFMTDFVQGGAEYAFDAANFFASLAKSPSSLKEADFFDEHSLDQQRAYQIACWIAGSSDASYKQIEKLGLFSQERLQRCPDEYRQIDHAWITLIRPHVVSADKAS